MNSPRSAKRRPKRNARTTVSAQRELIMKNCPAAVSAAVLSCAALSWAADAADAAATAAPPPQSCPVALVAARRVMATKLFQAIWSNRTSGCVRTDRLKSARTCCRSVRSDRRIGHARCPAVAATGLGPAAGLSGQLHDRTRACAGTPIAVVGFGGLDARSVLRTALFAIMINVAVARGVAHPVDSI